MARKADIKRYPLNMRTTKGVRQRLERAAAKSGRSLAQEVEWRLERSLDFDKHLVVACGDLWSPILIHKGALLIGLGDDPRDWPVSAGETPHEETTVILEITPEDLRRFMNYFSGAPPPYNYSNAEIEAAGDEWIQLQRDIKRRK